MWSNMQFRPVIQEETSFKDISYLELLQPICSVNWNHLCNIDYFEFETVVQEEMAFKGISYLKLYEPFR